MVQPVPSLLATQLVAMASRRVTKVAMMGMLRPRTGARAYARSSAVIPAAGAPPCRLTPVRRRVAMP